MNLNLDIPLSVTHFGLHFFAVNSLAPYVTRESSGWECKADLHSVTNNGSLLCDVTQLFKTSLAVAGHEVSIPCNEVGRLGSIHYRRERLLITLLFIFSRGAVYCFDRRHRLIAVALLFPNA